MRVTPSQIVTTVLVVAIALVVAALCAGIFLLPVDEPASF